MSEPFTQPDEKDLDPRTPLNWQKKYVNAHEENLRLREMIEGSGFRVVEGCFTLKSGKRSSIAIVPADGKKLLRMAMRALDDDD